MTTPGNHGRFDGYDVLAQSSHWDQVTQGVVLRRIGPPAPLRFFTEAFLRGQPHKAGIVKTLVEDAVEKFTP